MHRSQHPRGTIVATDIANVWITEEHSHAICAEIGDRLRISLNWLPPASSRLADVMARLSELDEHDSPSIVPSVEELAPDLAPA
jgi:hypothetical protein